MAFYSDYGVHHARRIVSNYCIRFTSHFDQYRNASFVRSVSYDAIVWC